MNLRSMANGIIVSVNGNIEATLRRNDGYDVDDFGKQVPKYIESTVIIQPQSLSSEDLQHPSMINRQGEFVSIYLNGAVHANRRWIDKGNDQFIFKPYGENDLVTWNVSHMAESFSDWVRLILWRS